MIDYVKGRLAEKHPTHVVIEAAGLGYRIQIPLSTFTHLGDVDTEAKLLTHHHLREDTEDLYGFATSEERSLFRLLIDVSGIGPRLAQTILSGLPAAQLREAMVQSDLVTLTRIPGVGKKTAERMVLELKEKVAKLVTEDGSGMPVVMGTDEGDEAVRALVALGYNRFEAQQSVDRIRKTDASMPLEEVVRAAISSVR